MHSYAAIALIALTAAFAGCGVGSGGPESKISTTTDTYLRSLASGDTTKACAQLTTAARSRLTPSCPNALRKVASRVGSHNLSTAADKGSSISINDIGATVTLNGMNDVRIGLVSSSAGWRIETGAGLAGA